MLAIYKRELRSCFTGIIGWLFMAAILAMFGLYFYVYNLLNGYPYVSYVFASMTFIMLIAVPILTMRIMSEDRHMKTDQLTLTAPVPIWKIVLGKYLALATLYTLDMLIISVTPLVLALYGTVPMGESYTAILGFWLYGLACIAIGLFISGMTESQIISAVTSFVVLFIGYMMPNLCALISEGGNILTKILSCYDLYSPLGPFNAGTLDLRSIVYFLSVIAVALFLSVQVIQYRRFGVSVKKIGLGIYSISTIIVGLAIAVGINFGMSKIPVEYTSLDVTYDKMFELTKETKDYVAGLDRDVTIYVMGTENSTDTTLVETLSRYRDLSSKLKVEYVNTTKEPTFSRKYTSDEVAAYSMIVVSDLRSRVVNYDDIYIKSIDYNTYQTSVDGYDAEGQITSAIEYVTMDNESMPKVYILTGHDEVGLGKSFSQSLAKSNINSESLNLLKSESVPEDCQMLIIYGPMADLSRDDYDKVVTYLQNGGTVLLTTGFEAGHLEHVAQLMDRYGITMVDGMVMEEDQDHTYSGIGYYLFPEILDCAYTSGIKNGYVFTPYSSGLRVDDENMDYDYTNILATSDKAYSIVIDDAGNESRSNGPFLLGVSASLADETGTLIVLGSIDIFEDEADEIVAGSNLELFDGIVSDTVTEARPYLPVIPSKPYTVDNLVITSAAGILTGLMIMILIPLVMVVSGIVIWAIRRRR